MGSHYLSSIIIMKFLASFVLNEMIIDFLMILRFTIASKGWDGASISIFS